MKKFVFLLTLLLVLSACGTANNDEDGNSQGAPVVADETENQETMSDEERLEQLVNEFSFDTEVSEDDLSATFNLSLKNNSDKAIDLLFPSGQQYEIVVTDPDSGEEVYRFSEGKAFTMALVTETIEPGDEKTWTEEWNYAKDGHRVEAKSYDVTVQLVVAEIDEFEIQDSVFTDQLSINVPELQITEEKEVEEEESKRIVNVEDSDHFRNVVIEGENGSYTVRGEAQVKDGQFSYTVEDGHFVFVNEEAVQLDAFSDWAEFELQIEIAEESMPQYGVLSLFLTYETEDSDEKQQHYIQLDDLN